MLLLCLKSHLFLLAIRYIGCLYNQWDAYFRLKSNEDLLAHYFNNPELKEALFLSSEALYSRLNDQDRIEELMVSLNKYICRASFRCTPFGLFAGCGLGSIDSTRVGLLEHEPKRKVRLDGRILDVLYNELIKLPEVKYAIRFMANNTIFKVGNFLRYLEYQYQKNDRKYVNAQVITNDYLDELIRFCRRPRKLKEIIDQLVAMGIEKEEAVPYVESLTDHRILVPENGPNVIEDYFFQELIQAIEAAGQIAGAEQKTWFNQAQDVLKKVEAFLLHEGQYSLKELSEKIQSELDFFGITFPQNSLFQVDLGFENSSLSLAQKDLHNVSEVVERLLQFYEKTTVHSPSNLEKLFRYLDEHHEGEAVPLLKLLDPEDGFLYGTESNVYSEDLLQDIGFSNEIPSSQLEWGMLEHKLFSLLQEARDNNVFELDLTNNEEFNKQPPKHSPPFQGTAMTLIKVLDNAPTPRIQFVVASGGAGDLINRFGFFPEQRSYLEEMGRHEEKSFPQKAVAEIVHYPDAGIRAISLRPSFRQFSIPVLTTKGDQEEVVALDSLMVYREKERVILYSKTLGKEVVPCLSNMHNYKKSDVPIYKFLADVSLQYKMPSISWSWGALVYEFSFTPRVVWNNIVLFPATWILDKSAIEALISQPESFSELQKKRRIPERFYIVQGDNHLFIDMANPLLRNTFFDEVKSRTRIQLQEFLFDLENPYITNKEGHSYTNEIMIPYIPRSGAQEKAAPINKAFLSANASNIQKKFLPGDQWLYYKVYCSPGAVEAIIAELLPDLSRDLLENRLVSHWFFIRYRDSKGTHLRLRFRLENDDMAGEVNRLFREEMEPHLNSGIIKEIELGTYVRELARYTIIEESELLFWADSQQAMFFLQEQNSNNDSTRWNYLVLAIDDLLTLFGFDIDDKAEFITGLFRSFEREFRLTQNIYMKKKVNKKCQMLRSEVSDLFLDKESAIKKIVYQKFRLLSGEQLDAIKKAYHALGPKEQQHFLAGHIHMICNRSFKVQPRFQEMIVYKLLVNQYNMKRYKKQA